MAAPVIQPSFASGELSPSLFARVDLAKFHSGAALLRNFFVDYRGGVSNRTGTEFIVPCFGGINRLIPFTFSTTQTYALLLSDLKCRFITNGGVLLEAPATITAASKADPCALTVANSWSAGDWIYVEQVTGMTRLNGRFFQLGSASATGVTLQDTNGNNIDSTGYGTYLGAGIASRVYTIPSPYAAADLHVLKYTQSADVMTFTHPSYVPYSLIRSGALSWAFSAISFAPTLAAPTNVTATSNSAATATTYRYIVTAVDGVSGTESPASSAGVVTNAATMSTTAAEHETVAWTNVTGATSYNVYRQREVPGGAASATEIYGFVGTATGTPFVDANISPDFSNTPPITYNPFASANNPGCSTYFQDRQIYGGSSANPETFWMSKTGDFANFNYSSPAKSDDSIVGTIASRQVNAIKHLLPLQQLIALSSNGAWRIDAGPVGGAITPTNIEAVPQAFNGCSDVPPIAINYDILYVQDKQSTVRDLAYNFYVNTYTGADMTVLANHLFKGHTITEWAWAEEPYKIVWAVRDDGYLLSFTFLKEQEVLAWAHHDTEGLFKSVCSISEGNEDVVYLVVSRRINGTIVQYVERMASREMGAKPDYVPPVPADLARAWFVDCGLQYPLTYPAAQVTPQTDGATGTGLFPVTYSIVGAVIVNGGSGYTSPSAFVTDLQGNGTGAVLSVTVVTGVITAVSVTTAGSGYVSPTVQIVDSTGTGGSIAVTPSNDVLMDFDTGITVVVGDMVRVNDGWGPVRVVNSVTQITVNVQQPLSSIWPADSGDWSCTTPVTAISGLDHLEGEVVSVLADGNVMSDGITNPLTVTDGAITLPVAASAIFIGLPYLGEFKSLYLDVPGSTPTVQGRRQSIDAITVRLQDSRGLRLGHSFDDLSEIKERDYQKMGNQILPFTGDERVIISGKYELDAQVCAQQRNPLPATLLGLIPEVSIGDS